MKMVSKMDVIKAKFNLKSISQLVTIFDSFRLYLENLTGVLLLFFSDEKRFNMTFKMAAITGWVITQFLQWYTARKK